MKKLLYYIKAVYTPLDSWEIINLDSEAVDKAENEAREVEQLRILVTRYEEERKLMMDEISQLKEMLKREVRQAENEQMNNTALINEYMLSRQKLDAQLHSVRAELEDLKVSIDYGVQLLFISIYDAAAFV